MKRITTCFTLATLFALFLSSLFAANIQDKKQIQAINKLQQASKETVKIQLDSRTGIPRFVNLRVSVPAPLTAEKAAYRFFEDYKDLFKMSNPSRDVSVKKIETDRLGATHVKMRQTLDEIPVFGREMIVHINSHNEIYAVNGSFSPEIQLESTTPAIGPADAINLALADVGPATYRWDTLLEQTLSQGQSYRPEAELLIYEKDGHSYLAYQTMIAIDQPEPANWVYFVDAKTGGILHRYNDLQDANAVGSGTSLYRGTVSINTNKKGKNYEMKDNPRNLWTYDANNALALPGKIFKDGDNTWGDGTNSNRQSAGVDAHWGAAVTHDYYMSTHGRNSFDGNGARVKSSVHYYVGYVNAYWDGQQLVYGDGDNFDAGPLVDLDVVSHEFTHGVTDYSANLIYQNQSGALNESVSDIFAMMIDSDDYTIGEDSWLSGNGYLRSMSDPSMGDPAQPKHMDDYVNTSGDNGGVHTNSGIPNFAAYLMTAGGNGKYGDAVSGIGREKVGKIWYRALTVYMTSSTDFEGARIATVQAATDLYGATEVQTVNDAWDAVGVTTTPDTDPPVISGVHEENVGTASADIVWDTDESATSVVNYGTSSGSYTDTASDAALVTAHRLTLTTLQPNTTYYYEVGSTDGSNNTSTSGEFSFTTQQVGQEDPMISAIDMSTKATGPWTKGLATVTVTSNGSPVSGAVVNVTWTGSASGTDQGTTDSNGEVVFQSGRTKDSNWSFTVTIDDITLSGYFWDTGNSESTDTISSTGLTAGRTVPETFELKQNYPNPFNPSTLISYQIPEAAQVTLNIYDLQGRLVNTLVNAEQPANTYSVSWNGTNVTGEKVASGIYIYELRAGSHFIKQQRMLLLK